MDVILYLIPIAFVFGGLGLAALFWALRTGQYDDPEGAAARILFEPDREEGRAEP